MATRGFEACPRCVAWAKAEGVDARALHFQMCMERCVHFLVHHAHIYDQDNRDIPFHLWRWQVDALQDQDAYQRNVVLKSRGIGFTWLMAGRYCWRAGLHGARVVVGSRKEELAVDLLKRIMYIRESVARTFDMALKKQGQTYIEFQSRGVIVSETASPEMGRGYHPTEFGLDEWAFLPQDREITASVMMAAGDRGRITGWSSPNGTGNEFYRYWQDAEAGRNAFHPRKLHWKDMGDKDARWSALHGPGWYEAQKKMLGDDRQMVAQELDCDFVQSGSPVFRVDDLDVVWGWKEGRSEHERRWPDASEPVIVSIDPAEGESHGAGDETSISIFDQRGDEIWKEGWQRTIPEAQRGLVDLLQRCAPYGTIVVVEHNGLGVAVSSFLRAAGPWRIEEVETTSGRGTEEKPPGGKITGNASMDQAERSYWRVPKSMQVLGLRRDIESQAFRAYDEVTRRQMMIYANVGPDQYSAPRGQRDDRVSSMMLGRWAYRKYWLKTVDQKVKRATGGRRSIDARLFTDN